MDRYTKLAGCIATLRQLGLDHVANTFEENLRKSGAEDVLKKVLAADPPPFAQNMPQQRKRFDERQQQKQKETTRQTLNAPLERAYKVLLKNLKKMNLLGTEGEKLNLDGEINVKSLPASIQPLLAELTSGVKSAYKPGTSEGELVNIMKQQITKIVNKVKSTEKNKQDAAKSSQEKANADRAQKAKGDVIDRQTGEKL